MCIRDRRKGEDRRELADLEAAARHGQADGNRRVQGECCSQCVGGFGRGELYAAEVDDAGGEMCIRDSDPARLRSAPSRAVCPLQRRHTDPTGPLGDR